MKFVEFSKYGSPDDLKLIEADIPTPGDNEVLIKIHASSMNSWDRELLHRANEGLDELGKLVNTGKVTPIIDRTFSLDEIVDAMKYYGDGYTKGKIVISIQHTRNELIESTHFVEIE